MGRSPGVRGRSRSGPPRRRRTCGPSGRRRAGRRRCAGRARRRSAGARCRSCRCPCGSRAAAARRPARRRPAAASCRPPRPPCRWPGSGRGRRSPPSARGGGDGPEALEVQSLGNAGAREAVGERVQQARRDRRPRSGARASRARADRARQRPSGRRGRRGARAACSGGGRARAREGRRRRSRASRDGATCTCATSGSPPGRCASARSIPMTGVTPLPAVTNSSGCSMRIREDELAGRRREPNQHALARMADEVLGHQSARNPLDGDRRCDRRAAAAPTSASSVRQCRTPSMSTPTRTYWPGRCVGPAAARSQPQRHAVARLGHHGLDAATRLARRPQRVQLPEKVVRKERCGEDCGGIKKDRCLEDGRYASRGSRTSATISGLESVPIQQLMAGRWTSCRPATQPAGHAVLRAATRQLRQRRSSLRRRVPIGAGRDRQRLTDGAS